MTRRAALLAPAVMVQAQAGAPRVGVIGLGHRGTAHLKALRSFPGVRVVAVSDVDPERMRRANGLLPERAAEYADYRELLKDRNVSAVVIATPNFLHSEMAIAALRAGKDVLLEKPIASTYSQARQLQYEASRSSQILAVGMQRRYARRDRQIQLVVDSGVLGKLHAGSASDWRGDWNPDGWQYTDPLTRVRTNWRHRKRTAGSSELELSIHTFAQIAAVVDSAVTRVTASGTAARYRDRETRDVSAALIEFDNGVRFTYSFCLFAKAGGGPPFALAGDQGTLRVEGGRVLLNNQPAPEYEKVEEAPEIRMYREFFDAVARRRPSELNADRAMAAAKIAFLLDLSIEAGRPALATELR